MTFFLFFFSSITQVSLFLWTKAPSLRGNRLGALTDVDNVRANIVKINGKLKQTKKNKEKSALSASTFNATTPVPCVSGAN